MKNKWFSDIQLNWEKVNSFISDVKVKNNIPAIKAIAADDSKTTSVIAEKSNSQCEKKADALDDVFVDRKKGANTEEPSTSSKSNRQSVAHIQKKTKENLIDIVEELDSCANARKSLSVFPVARVHCSYDDDVETFWFTKELYHPRELSDLCEYGRFVPQYSDLAIRLQKSKVGTCFSHRSINNIKRKELHQIRIENQSDLQNQTIAIAGDELTYQYRNIQEFLKALRQNLEDIKDIESRIKDLEEQKKDKTSQEKHKLRIRSKSIKRNIEFLRSSKRI